MEIGKKAIKKLIVWCTLLLGVVFIQARYSSLDEEYARIPAGTYILGEKKHRINPQHQETVSEFFISKTEVTNRLFSEFIKQTNYVTDAEKFKNALVFYPGLDEFEWSEDTTAYWRYPFGVKAGGIESKMNHPVTCISYRDALEYCKWAKVRLPTLSEWEIACRASTKTKYFWGNTTKTIYKYGNIWHGKNHRAVDSSEDALYTSPVGSYPPNPLGLYDMYGNVFEFCSGKPKVMQKYTEIACARGGSWWCSEKSCGYFNSVDIGSVNIRASFSNHGFRVVKLN